MFDHVTARYGWLALLVALGATATPAHATTWYASASKSSMATSGTACAQTNPCTLSYALGTKVTAGDTLMLFSGTYADKPDLNTPSKHSKLTMTSLPTVFSALTFHICI